MSYTATPIFRHFRTGLYVILLGISLGLSYRQNHEMQYLVDRWRLEWTGKLNSFTRFWTRLFDLTRANRKLMEENARLYELLGKGGNRAFRQFETVAGEVVAGKFRGRDRFIIIDKGSTDGIKQNDGVWTSEGVAGMVVRTSPHFSKVRILTHPDMALSVKLKHTSDAGFTMAEGEQGPFIRVVDIPYEARVRPGDTVVTSGASLIFPAGMPVGKVIQVENKSTEEKILTVELFAMPCKIRYVYAGHHPLRKELEELKNEN